MTYGESFRQAVADYLTANRLVSLGGINGTILADLAQRHHDHWEATHKPAKAPKPPRPAPDALSDADWLAKLSESPANKGVDVPAEYERAKMWVSQQPGRRFTRRFFLTWLLKTDRPLPTSGSNGHKPPSGNPLYTLPSFDWCRTIATMWPRANYPDRPAFEEMAWKDVPITVRQEILKYSP